MILASKLDWISCGSRPAGKLSIQLKPSSSRALSAVLFPEPDRPLMTINFTPLMPRQLGVEKLRTVLDRFAFFANPEHLVDRRRLVRE